LAKLESYIEEKKMDLMRINDYLFYLDAKKKGSIP